MIEALATGGSLEDALNELKTKGELDYVGSQSEYGCYLISINGYVPDAAEHEFWAIYTSLTEYDGVTYSNEESGRMIMREKRMSVQLMGFPVCR